MRALIAKLISFKYYEPIEDFEQVTLKKIKEFIFNEFHIKGAVEKKQFTILTYNFLNFKK